MISTTEAGTGAPPVAPQPAAGKLINIDNGGTLTDICVIDGARIYRTKTVTTPYDLSKCLFEGLKKAARTIYGDDDVQRLLQSTDFIRYSTTQGTNALVERKGPRLGLILGGGLDVAALAAAADDHLRAQLIGPRIEALDAALAGEALDAAVVRATNGLASAGANRIVVACGGRGCEAREAQLKRILLRKFPPHLLGAIPILFSHEVVDDHDDVRRTWTALFNAFLHPAMEHFLYSAEHKLRAYRTRNPLLIFRNDGQSARVAKTIAVKTYSSGPRGGVEGARALAQHYGFERLLTMDIGGTTTDMALVEKGVVRAQRRGHIEGVATSFALCDVVSVGVGGSSIIKVDAGTLVVGPESVGGAPGPACFGLGGKEATMTDAFLVMGLLDPASFFGGELRIDVARARAAIAERVAGPLGVDETAALRMMENAWVEKVASSLMEFARIDATTVLAAFGGAGPFVACRVAQAAGIGAVIIPGLAAVFSAYGIGFSDIGHQYEAVLPSADDTGLAQCRALLLERAARGMFAENTALDQCRISATLQVLVNGREEEIALASDRLPAGLPAGARMALRLDVVRPIAHTTISGLFGRAAHPAHAEGSRNVQVGGAHAALPLYRIETLDAGAAGAGPAVLEEDFYTCRIDAGWHFEFNDAGDVMLRHD
jgi:N-methylhydantoinase A/oxoprolinase/acetone carboxylase beta subunit